MDDEYQAVTANLPPDLASSLDERVARTKRSASSIIAEALAEWLAEDQRRHELTLEGLRDIDEGRTLSHEEVIEHFEQRKRERREAKNHSA